MRSRTGHPDGGMHAAGAAASADEDDAAEDVQGGRQGMQGSGQQQAILLALRKGQALKLLGVTPEQHFTRPPPRYTEASLVKALEQLGIGRPSTYAATLKVLQVAAPYTPQWLPRRMPLLCQYRHVLQSTRPIETGQCLSCCAS